MYDEKIKKYLYNEEYDLLIQEVDKEIEDNSFEASFYYYRFLAKNKDYSHMDFNNFIDKDDYNRAMELDFMHTFDTEFKFFKILNNEERKLFQYANHMNLAKFNEAIKSFNVSNSNTFLNRDEARALSEYANTLTENTQKELTGKLLLFYIEDRKWDPTLRSVKNMVEDVVLLFESSLFHKIEKGETQKEIKEAEATFPNSSKEIDSTTKVKEDIAPKGNIEIREEEGKTISKQANTNVDVETKKNVTIIPPKDYSSIKAPKRMYSNGSTYINRTILDDEYTPKEVKPINQKSSEKSVVAKGIIAFGIVIVTVVLLVALIVNAKKTNNIDSNGGSQQQQVDNRPVEIYYSWSWPDTNVIRVYLSCSTTHYGKKVRAVYGQLQYRDGNDDCYLDITIPLKRTPFDISLTPDENDDYGYTLWFHYEKIIYEDGTVESYYEYEYIR